MQHVATWFAARSIKTKMLAGFACVLVILLAVAGVGYWRFLGVVCITACQPPLDRGRRGRHGSEAQQ
jgi:hypothetical protein